MRHDVPDAEDALALAERVDPKYRTVWDGRPPEKRIALARHFLPHRSSKTTLIPSRPRVVKWYCPFASQHDFPSGHRYCINVYTGCAHSCVYCYAASYQPENAASKVGFEQLVVKDMEDLERFDVPPAPVHLSNSTDLFQPLEERHGHARYALEQILAHRKRFTTVTVLTKNPMLPVRLGYIDLLTALGSLPADHPKRDDFGRRNLPSCVVEVSLAFWRETARAVYDPHAPSVEERIKGIRALHEAKIPLVLRIDPLFPRSPLTKSPPRSLTDLGLPEAQTIEDLENLVTLAREVEARHVVYSAAKITQPRGRKLPHVMVAMREAYREIAAPEKAVLRSCSWRLPHGVAETRVIRPFLEICRNRNVIAKHCKRSLIETP